MYAMQSGSADVFSNVFDRWDFSYMLKIVGKNEEETFVI